MCGDVCSAESQRDGPIALCSPTRSLTTAISCMGRDPVLPQEAGVSSYKILRPILSRHVSVPEEAEKLGFSEIRAVEHYFHYYGGCYANPRLFLAAAATPYRTIPAGLGGTFGRMKDLSEIWPRGRTPQRVTGGGPGRTVWRATPLARLERTQQGPSRWPADGAVYPTAARFIFSL
jgi:hypothetical protein